MPIKMKIADNSSKNKKRLIAASGAYVAKKGSTNNIQGKNYAGAQTAITPVTKSAQFAGSGANAIWSQPMFFSPMHTPQNWQIANKRKEVYQWLFASSAQVLTSDYTFKSFDELLFNYDSVTKDVLTGGLLYENVDSESILGATGELRKFSHYAIRDCIDKRCFSLSGYGYWRPLEVSEEHPIVILDGKLYRSKKKIQNQATDRRKKGIVSNDVKKVIIPDKLICRKEAQDVS